MSNPLEAIALYALQRAYQVYVELGLSGEELVAKNQFGETALRVDVEIEKAIIQTLREANLPIRIVSEEHGVVDLAENPVYLGVLDGLDGSNVYKRTRGKGRCGTMFGVFSGLYPRYDDYVFSGIMEFPAGKLYFAVKNEGSFLVARSEQTAIRCADISELSRDIKIYICEAYDINVRIFSEELCGFNTSYTGSSAVNYADVASGKAGLVLECTRKGNLEIAVAYGMIREAGGIMVTLDGKEIGQERYFEFGQKENMPIITAATGELACSLISYLKPQG